MKGRIQETGQNSFLIVLFLAVPIFFGLFGGRIMFGETDQKWKEGVEERLGEFLGEIGSDKDPIMSYSRFFRRIEKKAFSGKDPRATWKNIDRFLKKKFPGQMEVIFLDETGKPVGDLMDRPVSRALAQKFFQAYQVFLKEKKALPETVQAFMKNFLGNFIPVDHEVSRILCFASGRPKEWYVYFSEPHPEGMFFLFFKPAEPLEKMAFQEKLRRLERASPNLRLFLAIRGKKETALAEKLGLRDVRGFGLWEVLRKAGNGRIWFGDTLVGYRVLSPGYWVIGSLARRPGTVESEESLRVPLVPTFALLALVIFALSRCFPAGMFSSSVRIKLLALFLYSALVPLIVMGVTARKYLSERQIVLENEIHSEVEKSIRAFDGRFREFTLDVRENLENYHYTLKLASQSAFQDFTEHFGHYQKTFGFDLARLFDGSGKVVWDFYHPEAPTFFGGLLKLMPKIALRAFRSFSIESHKPAPGEPQKGPSPPQKNPGKDFIDALIPNLSAQTLQEVRFGDVEVFLATIPLGNQLNLMTHFGLLVWFREKMEAGYVRNKLPTFARTCDQGLFYAWNPDAMEKIIPPLYARTARVRTLQRFVSSNSSSFRRIVRWHGRSYLLTGLRGTQLKYMSFLCVTSYRKILADIDGLRWQAGFVSCAIMGMCFLITFLLSRFIIEPLGNITQGIAAISRRDFHFQIPIQARDELGTLAEVFNKTMEDLKDLEVARTIQERLFPKAPLTAGTWEVYGTCRPASQVGGDYFDYLPLGGDRALIIIGDVSGHGVGAALVVAMAKALVTQFAAALEKPEDLLTALNHLLLTILKKKKMMSCCLAILDGAAGTMNLVNAGHCSPLSISSHETSFVKMTGYPLGSSKNWKPVRGAITLGKNQVVLFYSDGLIEALDQQGQQIGYERFEAKSAELIRKNAAATEVAIRAWHDDLSRRPSPDDDISLVVVQESHLQGGRP